MPMLRAGDVVRHLNCPEWGPGLVVEIKGSVAVICFEQSERHREFRIPTDAVTVEAEGTAVPRRCPHKSARASSAKRKPSAPKVVMTWEAMVAAFRARFAEGFASPKWSAERAVRDEAAAKLKSSLSKDKWTALVAAGSIEELGKTHREIVHKASLIHPVQAMKLAAIKDGAFWTAYAEWAWSDAANATAFDLMMQGLATAGQANWPNVTALRAVLHPATDFLAKPESTKRAAAAIAFELGYESKPTLDGYKRMLELASKLREKLAAEGMNAKDLWDVASFVKLAGPEEEPKPKKKRAAKATADAGAAAKGSGEAAAT